MFDMFGLQVFDSPTPPRKKVSEYGELADAQLEAYLSGLKVKELEEEVLMLKARVDDLVSYLKASGRNDKR